MTASGLILPGLPYIGRLPCLTSHPLRPTRPFGRRPPSPNANIKRQRRDLQPTLRPHLLGIKALSRHQLRQ
eukprot:353517-Chlamydomonas_euryale.AAC.9